MDDDAERKTNSEESAHKGELERTLERQKSIMDEKGL